MRLIVAPDKFKGSLTATEAALAITRGASAAAPEAEVEAVPMADGGEGTVEALVNATSGRVLKASVTGPLGETVEAPFGLLGDAQTAVVEMAAASGLVLVPKGLRDPSRTTTRGTGELLLAAIDAGARRKYCDWQMDNERVREENIGLLLPDLQGFRDLSILLAARARLQLSEGRYGDAVASLASIFRLGRDLSKMPFMITGLVGIAGISAGCEQLEAAMV